MTYTPYYPGGWHDSPSAATPITAAALQNIETGVGAVTTVAAANTTAITANTTAIAANATAIGAETTRATAAEALLMPLTSSFSLANNSYQSIQAWTVTGQTDSPLAPFGTIAGSQTYGGIQGPAFWFGYNPALLSASVSSSAHGAVGMSCFGDAGDTNNGAGGHGLEMNVAAFRSANGLVSTNAMEMVAVDDNTNTVNTVLRCGTGNVNGIFSGITFQKSDASMTYMIMGPVVSDNISILRPITFSGVTFTQSVAATATWSLTSTAGSMLFELFAQGTSALAQFIATSATGTAQFILNGNTAISSQMVFQKNGVNTWILEDSAGTSMYLVNNSGNIHALYASGTNTAGNYDNAQTYFLTKTLIYGSLVINNGGSALATTATKGFIYIPTCAGPPTGVPAANTGTSPVVYDTTNNKLMVYNGGWKGVVLS